MRVDSAEFVISNTDIDKCPKPDRAEYAFIGRSNVGKSSLINMLTNKKDLAKTSSRPGKTQLINHFIINNNWYLVDLPGYGYAKVNKSLKQNWEKFIRKYIIYRENLINLFVLVDSRHNPQKIDLEFFEWLGENGIPFSIIFTKSDKLTSRALKASIENYKNVLLEQWDELPQTFISSSSDKRGKEEILNYIEEINNNVKM